MGTQDLGGPTAHSPDCKRRRRRNPKRVEYAGDDWSDEQLDSEIEEAFMRTLWAVAWADWAEENDELPSGEDLMAVAPDEPVGDDVLLPANRAMLKIERRNKSSLAELYRQAAVAPGKHYQDATPEDFGYALAMMALGTGVAWDDNHPNFVVAATGRTLDTTMFLEVWADSDDGEYFTMGSSGP